MIPSEIEEAFFRGEATAKTRFGVNAPVSIVAGPFGGMRGSVISLVVLEPEPMYLVENGENGEDVMVPQSVLGADDR